MKNVERDRSVIWRYLGWSVAIGVFLGAISGAFLVALTPELYDATVELKPSSDLASHQDLLESDYLLVQYVAKNGSRDSERDDFYHQLEKMITVEADKQQSLIRLSVRHSNGKTASEIALGLVDAAAEVQRDREQLRGEARLATAQAMHSKWMAQLESLEPGRDQVQIDSLVKKLALVSEFSQQKAKAPSSELSIFQSPVISPVVRTQDHLATMGIGALRGVLWCVGLCLLCIAALPSVVLPAKRTESAVGAAGIKGSSWLDGEVLRE
jgi:hypothetical protein